MKTFAEFMTEASKWRSDDILRKLYRKERYRSGDYFAEKMPRIEALKKAKKFLGLDDDLPGFRSWLDKLPYRGNPDAEAKEKMLRGEQPKHVYRGSLSLKGIKDGGDYANNKDPVIHGTPRASAASGYSRGTPSTFSREDVYATSLPAEKIPGTNYSDQPRIIGRFKTNKDQRYTYDPGLESGEIGETPEEMLKSAESPRDMENKLLHNSAETNLAKNKFDNFMLHRKRGLDKKGKLKPQFAVISPEKMQQLMPNLKII